MQTWNLNIVCKINIKTKETRSAFSPEEEFENKEEWILYNIYIFTFNSFWHDSKGWISVLIFCLLHRVLLIMIILFPHKYSVNLCYKARALIYLDPLAALKCARHKSSRERSWEREEEFFSFDRSSRSCYVRLSALNPQSNYYKIN